MPRPLPVSSWIDCDDVDLAMQGIHLGMQLGPAKAQELAVAFVETEPVGVKPWFRHGGFEAGASHTGLLGVPGECAIVEPNQGIDIVWREGAGLERGAGYGEVTPHLPQVSIRRCTERLCSSIGRVSDVMYPKLSGATTRCGNLIDLLDQPIWVVRVICVISS